MRRILIPALALVFAASCGGPVSVDGTSVKFEGRTVGSFESVTRGEFSVKDRSRMLDGGIIEFERTFTAKEDIDSARVELQFVRGSASSYAMIPAVCYNGNEWGRGNEPKGFATDGVTHTYSCRRTPVPGASYSEGDGVAVAMWSDAPSCVEDCFSCAILPGGSTTVHSLIRPVEEGPRTYDRRDHFTDGTYSRMDLKKGDKLSIKAYLLVSGLLPDHASIGTFMDAAWQLADKSQIAPDPDNEKIWQLGVRYAKESLWAEEGEYRGLSIGLQPNASDKGWHQREGGKYEVGWCGQNASYANSLLTDYLKTGDKESLEKGVAILDTWSKPSTVLPNGLYITQWDYILYGAENRNLDGCNLGTAAWMFFEGADLLRKCNAGDPERLETIALNILDFVKADQQSDGCYARGWHSDGSCIYRDGTVGAFLIAPMAEAAKRTGDNSYLESAKAAFAYYSGQYRENGYTTAGALDTWCIDKESSITLVQGGLMLYDATGDYSYVEAAEQSAYYLSTWMWHYRELYPEDCDFTKFGLDTFGLTAVSTQHQHLDPYALKYVPDLLRLAEITGNQTWKERARAIWNGGCQLVSDGTLTINGRVRPAGSQNEAFLHCDWGWNGNPGSNRLNDWLVAWPGAFRLEALRRIDSYGLTMD